MRNYDQYNIANCLTQKLNLHIELREKDFSKTGELKKKVKSDFKKGFYLLFQIKRLVF